MTARPRTTSGFRAVAFAFAPLACLLAMGCGRHTGKPKDAADKSTPKPTEVTAKRFTGRWMEKLQGGRVRKVMEVHSGRGVLDSASNSGNLYEVDGIIYRDGVAKAKYTAPEVTADKATQKVVARSGVVLTSLDPPGATVRCQTMTWYADQHRIIAEGDVYFQYAPNQQGQPGISGGPYAHLTIDTDLRYLTIP